jgi:hypothetical protein
MGTAKVSWAAHGGFSGPVIHGTVKSPPLTSMDRGHVARADYLTFMVESGGLFGGIMGADGTVITAGRGQHAMVLPKVNSLGDLPALMFAMSKCDSDPVKELITELDGSGLHLTSDGFLTDRHGVTKKATPMDMRIILSVEGGNVPRGGESWDRASRWAMLFHDAFADPVTFKTQAEFDQDDLIESFNALRVPGGLCFESVYRRKLSRDLMVVSGAMAAGLYVSEELDLIMGIWHSFKVNGPSIARQILGKAMVLDNDADPALMRPVASLPMLLATSNYGRWNRTIPSGRWDRTMKIIRQSGIWSDAVIDRVMSKV